MGFDEDLRLGRAKGNLEGGFAFKPRLDRPVLAVHRALQDDQFFPRLQVAMGLIAGGMVVSGVRQVHPLLAVGEDHIPLPDGANRGDGIQDRSQENHDQHDHADAGQWMPALRGVIWFDGGAPLLYTLCSG